MKILFSSIVGRYPFGGVAWCSLMYLVGLRALGHDVCYIEDTGECVYDPEQNTLSPDPSYGTKHIHNALEPYGFGDRWSYVNYDGTYHGLSQDAIRAFCADADLFVNLSGGTWFWRDEYARIPKRIFIDSDPVFTQLAIAKGVAWYVDFFRHFDHLFTFGANIGTPRCAVPTGEFHWEKTWQPVVTGLWRTETPATRDRFTTVMTWRTESFTDVDGNKDREFMRFIELPALTPSRFEIAVCCGCVSKWSFLSNVRVNNAFTNDFKQRRGGIFKIAPLVDVVHERRPSDKQRSLRGQQSQVEGLHCARRLTEKRKHSHWF